MLHPRDSTTPISGRAAAARGHAPYVHIIGTASPPTLGPGDLEITQSQVDAFVMRTRTRTRSGVTLPVSLVSYKVTKDKQVATVTETLASGLQTITPDSLTSEAEVINLGNATSLKIQGEVASLFAGKSTTTKIDDLVPREFLGVVQTFITSQLIAGTIVDPPVLSTGDLEKTETQVDVFNKRVDIKTRAGITLPITLTGGKKIVSRFGVQLIADEVITLAVSGTQTIPPTGPNLIDAAIKQIGSGMEVLTTLTVTGGIWPTITSKFFDEEMQVFNTQDQQIVDPSYTPASSSNYVEQTRALDQWHSRRIRSNRTAGAVSKATALISIDYRPYSFPGTFDYSTYLTFLHGTGYRRSVASVSKHTIRTWWLYRNPGPPTVGPTGTGMDVEIDDIVTDTVNIPIYATGNITLFERFPNVLHDAIVTTQGLVYPATTPSFSQYFRGSVSGTGVVNSVSLFSPGNGYAVGNVLNISDGSGHNVQVQITRLGVSNSILAWTQLSPGNYPNPAAPNPNVYGPFAGGGSGTGALFYVDAVTVTSSAPGTAWVGTERAIGCKVTPTNIPFLWKIQLISTIMR